MSRESARAAEARYRAKPEYAANITRKRRERKLKAIEYKGGACQRCSGVFPAAVYDFHHTDSTLKSDNPATILRGSWERARVELDKCVLLCANCHRTTHAEERDALAL